MTKVRLDTYLVKEKLVVSRTKAQDLIKGNNVLVNSKIINKSNYLVDESDEINIVNFDNFVSRAAHKLDYALKQFNIDLSNKVVLDIGSSTGGFSQVCLINNVKHIYAIDVGTKQMDKSIADHKKITLYENTDFRNVDKSMFDHQIDFVCCDVSFISLTKIIDKLMELISHEYCGVFLIKPQFEQDTKITNFNGVISDPKLQQKAINKIKNYFVKNNFRIIDLCHSPITGRKGNKEFLIYVQHKK